MMKTWIKELYFQFRWALPIWMLWILTTWWPTNRITAQIRGWLYRPFFKKCGKNFLIANGVQLLNTHEIEIGNDVYLSYYAWLNGLGGLTLEDEVVIGPYVTISTLTHCYKNSSFRFAGAQSAPVKIGRGSWLASHVSVSYGVTIGSGCLVAANSAVTKDIPDGMIAGGVPAKEIGKCKEDKEPTLMSRSGFDKSP
jgi:maltose O-acetyltransferase